MRRIDEEHGGQNSSLWLNTVVDVVARIFFDFSQKILWFSLKTFQNPNDEMNGIEGLFIENG